MRIGVEAWGLSGDLLATGMGQYTHHLLISLPQLDPNTSVIAYAGPAEPRPAWLPANVEWRAVGRPMPAKLTALHSRLAALPRVVASDHLDLFHATAVHMRPFFPPVPRLECPVVVTLHDVIPLTYYRLSDLPVRQQVFYRWNLHRAIGADALITVSDHSRSEISSTLGISRDRLDVVHNGVEFPPNPDPSPVTRLGIERPYLVYAGSFEPRKNLIGALRAYRLLADQGHPHTLVAVVERRSGHQDVVLAELDQLRLRGRVRLVHSLELADLRSLYTHADLLIFPSLAEGFGFPPVQAAAAGVPAVVSDLPVLREVMRDAAVYVDPRDHRAMAAAITSVLVDAALCDRLRERGKMRSAEYSQERCTRAHLELYANVLSTRVAARVAGAAAEA